MKMRRQEEEDDECPKLRPKSERCPTLYTDANGSSRTVLHDDDSDSSGSRKAFGHVQSSEPVMNNNTERWDNHSGSSRNNNNNNSRYLLHDSSAFYLRTFHGGSDTIANNSRQLYQRMTVARSGNNNKNNNKNSHNGGHNNASSHDRKTGTQIRETPKCAKCKNHKIIVDLKDHKRYCPYTYCECYECLIVTERQKVMALQVAVKRAQVQDEKTGCRPVYDATLLRLQRRETYVMPNNIAWPNPVFQPVTTVPPPVASSSKCSGSVNATEHHRRLQALKQMLDSFHSQGVDGTLICSYIILKECDFVVDKAFEKILDARNDIGSYTGRDPSNLVAPSSNNYWSTVVPQGAASQSTALLYPQLNCLPPYYGYPFPSSAAAAASGNAAATAAAAAAWQAAAGASGSGHPLMKAEPISLCSYPPVVQHPSSAGALNSVSSSLGGPGQPPPMMEITTSGDSRGSDCRGDDSDREGVVPGQERSVSVDRGMGSNDDVQSDRTPPGPGTEDAATSPNSALVLRSSFQPTSLSFAALHSYKNRTQSIES